MPRRIPSVLYYCRHLGSMDSTQCGNYIIVIIWALWIPHSVKIILLSSGAAFNNTSGGQILTLGCRVGAGGQSSHLITNQRHLPAPHIAGRLKSHKTVSSLGSSKLEHLLWAPTPGPPLPQPNSPIEPSSTPVPGLSDFPTQKLTKASWTCLKIVTPPRYYCW